MAATVVNTPGTPVIVRNRPVSLGSVTATTQAVQFSLPISSNTPNGNDLLTIIGVGGTLTNVNPNLEFSLDGTNWAQVTVASQAAAFTVAANPFTDTAATAAGSFNISGLQGALFRAGFTVTSGTAVVWVLFG